MIEDGFSQRQVACALGVSPSVVNRLGLVIWRLKFTAEGQGRVDQGQQLIVRIVICGI